MKQPNPAPPLRGLWAILGVAALCRGAAGIAVARAPANSSLAQQAPAAPDFDHLRKSVIRISAVSAKFDWLHPFVHGKDGVGLGSGFVVQVKPYPLFVTNAHVVRDAKKVTLQLLLYGAKSWDADVVSVCPKFDLALLVLRDHDKFTSALTQRGITLQALKLADGIASMGMDVVALGFPLGQDALKISKGNVAGNEEVNGNICIQSTAPISPGNSGGPLLDVSGREVVGVNFAKATKGENINYVIPVWRVKQMVRKHLKDQPEIPKSGKWKRVQVWVPKLALTTITPNDPLYEMSKCSKGIYVSKIGARSPFRKANPPIEEGSFLTSVNGKVLDRFGSGMNEKFVADRVAFTDLIWMTEEIFGDIEVESCFKGTTTKHAVRMTWEPEYERGLQFYYEPAMAKMGERYEMFGGISVMQMTVNHVRAVLRSFHDPGPTRWLHPEFIAEPRLMINFVQKGTYPATIFATGSAVSKLNGVPVRTLEDFVEHFEPKNGNRMWTLETDKGQFMVLNFNDTLQKQVKTGMRVRHLLTSAVIKAARKQGSAPADPVQDLIPGHDAKDDVQGLNPFGKREDPSVSLAAVGITDVAPLDAPPEVAGPLLVRALGDGRRGAVVDDALHDEADADIEFLDGDVPSAWDEALA